MKTQRLPLVHRRKLIPLMQSVGISMSKGQGALNSAVDHYHSMSTMLAKNGYSMVHYDSHISNMITKSGREVPTLA